VSKKNFQIPFARPHSLRRVIFFHHAGGSSLSFLRLARGVPESYEVLLAEMPGRGFRHGEPQVDSLQEYVSELIDVVRQLPIKQTVYFGHSLGALVAYELAKAIPPDQLVVSACRAPNEIHSKSEFLQNSSFSDEELLGYMRDFSSLPKEMNLEEEYAKSFFLPVLRGDLSLLRSYEIKSEPVATDIWALGGDSDAIVSPEDLEEWRSFGKRFQKKIYAGGHFYPWESVVFSDLFSALEAR